MNTDVVQAFLPAIVLGVAVQQLLEVLDGWLAGFFGPPYEQRKPLWLGLIGLLIGILGSFFGNITILDHLGVPVSGINPLIDHLVTGLVAGSGSAGFNSILKLLNYSKESSKASAAIAKAAAARTPAAPLMTANSLSLVDPHTAQALVGPGAEAALLRDLGSLRDLFIRRAQPQAPAPPQPPAPPAAP